MIKRLFSCFLILCLLGTLILPASVHAEDKPDPDLINAPFLEEGAEAQVSLVPGVTEFAFFRFCPTVTDTYTFSSTSDFDTVIFLVDQYGYVIQNDDDSGEEYNFALTTDLEAGETYYWAIASYGEEPETFPVKIEQTHHWVYQITKESTCTEDGEIITVCKHCEEIAATEVIPAAHDWQNGVCVHCGDMLHRSGTCGDGISWVLDHTGTLTLTGSGVLPDYAPFDVLHNNMLFDVDESYYKVDPAPWREYADLVLSVQIDPRITGLGQHVFWGLSQLKTLEIPEGISTISYRAIAYCPSLTSVRLPSTLAVLDLVFAYCDNLRTIEFCGRPPRASVMVLSELEDMKQLPTICYHSSAGGWEWVMENWYLPNGIQWYDLDSSTAPEDFALLQTSLTLQLGESAKLETNADSYVQSLLTRWESSDPSVVYVSGSGSVTGIKPGTATVTVSSEDGAYQASCQITVEGTADGESSSVELTGDYAPNRSRNDYERWDKVPTSWIAEYGGSIDQIQYISGTGVVVNRYDAARALTDTWTIEPELPLVGGFFSGEQWNFLVFGQTNLAESNDAEVLRIVRYTKDWARMDHCSVFGANTTVPFDAGTADLAEAGGKLYLHTCHEMYTSHDGLNHQANMTFVIDQQTMTVVDSWYSVMSIEYGYVSHSFSQRIRTTDEYVFRADHGDAYPRSIVLTRARVDGYIIDAINLDLLVLQGRTGQNETGSSLGGLELSSDNCLVVGNSVDHSASSIDLLHGKRNIFLCVADQDLTESKFLWLTNYGPEDPVFVYTPQLVKLSDNLFLVMWEQGDEYQARETCLVVIDGDGNALTETLTLECALSDCQPIVTEDGLVCWFANGTRNMLLYQLHWNQLITDPEAVVQTMGHHMTVEVVAPTCTGEGYTTYSCETCDLSYSVDFLEPLGHESGEWVTVVEPTCYRNGRRQAVCSRCGYVVEETLPTLSHNYEVVNQPPTCEDPGYVTYTCRSCGFNFREEGDPPTGHEMGEWYVLTQPTCVNVGTEQQNCIHCGKIERRFIPVVSHSYDEYVTEPTCTKGGYTDFSCKICGYGYRDDYTEALGHEYGEPEVLKPATCHSQGQEVQYCIRCNNRQTYYTPTTDHSYTETVREATCTEGGYTDFRCDVCGHTKQDNYTEALGHDFGDWTTVTSATCQAEGQETRSCTRCTETERRSIPITEHSYTATVTKPTCTEGGYTEFRCDVCGHTRQDSYTEALGHDFGDWTTVTPATCQAEGQEVRSCTRCAETETRSIAMLDHSYAKTVQEATCTEGGCTIYTCACGDSYTEGYVQPLGHDWDETFCRRCGASKDSPFTDVSSTDFFFAPVLWAVDRGITAGTSPTTFSPNATCTRAQVVTFLWRAMGQPEPEIAENPFTDVSEADYFYKPVLWALENGITAGTSPTTFAPNNPCTRDQVVTFLWRAMGKPVAENRNNPFSDVAETAYYYEPVLWAVENGITAGTSPTTFAPSNPCTRAQVVTFLYRSMK